MILSCDKYKITIYYYLCTLCRTKYLRLGWKNKLNPADFKSEFEGLIWGFDSRQGEKKNESSGKQKCKLFKSHSIQILHENLWVKRDRWSK